MGNGSLSHISAEEIVEDCGVQWSDLLFAKAVVVGLNLWRFEVVRLVNHALDYSGVVDAELFHGGVLVLKVSSLNRDEESIELLLLISISILLNDNSGRKMMKKLVFEFVKRIDVGISSEVVENFLSITLSLGVVFESLSGASQV